MVKTQPTKKSPEKSPKPIGRPPKYTDPVVMQAKIEEYFEECATPRPVEKVTKRGEIITVNEPLLPLIDDLVLFLGFGSRNALHELKKKSPAFRDIITRARMICGVMLNRATMAGKVSERTGNLNLAAHYGMSTKQEIKATLSLHPTIEAVAKLLAGQAADNRDSRDSGAGSED